MHFSIFVNIDIVTMIPCWSGWTGLIHASFTYSSLWCKWHINLTLKQADFNHAGAWRDDHYLDLSQLS